MGFDASSSTVGVDTLSQPECGRASQIPWGLGGQFSCRKSIPMGVGLDLDPGPARAPAAAKPPVSCFYLNLK